MWGTGAWVNAEATEIGFVGQLRFDLVFRED